MDRDPYSFTTAALRRNWSTLTSGSTSTRAGHLQGARAEPDRPRAHPQLRQGGERRRPRLQRDGEGSPPPRAPSASGRPLEMGGQVPLREPDPAEPQGQEGQAREDERQVEPVPPTEESPDAICM